MTFSDSEFALTLLSELRKEDLQHWCYTHEMRYRANESKHLLIEKIIENLSPLGVLDKMTTAFLKDLCQKKGIKGYSMRKKVDLLTLIREQWPSVSTPKKKKNKLNPNGPHGRSGKATPSETSIDDTSEDADSLFGESFFEDLFNETAREIVSKERSWSYEQLKQAVPSEYEGDELTFLTLMARFFLALS